MAGETTKQARDLTEQNVSTQRAELGKKLTQIIALANELRTDHGTNVTHDTSVTALANELRTDHATTKAAVDALVGLANELRTDHATFKTAVDNLRTFIGQQVFTQVGLQAGSADSKKIRHNASAVYTVQGKMYTQTAQEIDFTASSHDIVALSNNVNAAAYLVSLSSDGSGFITKGSSTGGGSAVNVPAATANRAPIGYATIVVASGATPFNATTDVLTAASTHLTVSYTDMGISLGEIGAAPATITASSCPAGPATITASSVPAAAATITAAAVDSLV